MKKAYLVSLLFILALGFGQKSVVDGRLDGIRRVANETVGVQLRGCWQHEGAVRCGFAFSTAWVNMNTLLTLRTADVSATYVPASAAGTTQAEPQTVRARLITLPDTAEQGVKLDLALDIMPTIVLVDLPVPPTVKTLGVVKVGGFTFDGVPVAEKLPSEELLVASYVGPEALSFQLGQFRLEFTDIFMLSNYSIYSDRQAENAVLRFRLTNTGPEASFNASWRLRYFAGSAEIWPGLNWWCDGATPPKLVSGGSTACYLRLEVGNSYHHFKELIPLLEIGVNDQNRVLRKVYLSRYLR